MVGADASPRMEVTIMDASTPHSRLRRPNGLRAGVVIGLAFALVGAGVGTATGAVTITPFQQVLVVNPPANPVEVAGTVNVGNTPANQNVTVTNLPATQPVSGTVNVGNLPATQLATKAYDGNRGIDAQESFNFAFGRTINVSTLIIENHGYDDALWISLETAGGPFVLIRDGDGSYTQDFTMPVPAKSVNVSCHNLVLNCEVTVSVLGS